METRHVGNLPKPYLITPSETQFTHLPTMEKVIALLEEPHSLQTIVTGLDLRNPAPFLGEECCLENEP